MAQYLPYETYPRVTGTIANAHAICAALSLAVSGAGTDAPRRHVFALDARASATRAPIARLGEKIDVSVSGHPFVSKLLFIGVNLPGRAGCHRKVLPHNGIEKVNGKNQHFRDIRLSGGKFDSRCTYETF